MAIQGLVNETLRITVQFHDWASAGAPVADPVSAVVIIHRLDGSTVLSATPTRVDTGTYRYDWTPVASGDFLVEFDGTFSVGTDVVEDEFEILEVVGSSATTLDEDQYLVFATSYSPMYIDPDEVLAIYPDAPPTDIAEFIMIASTEVDSLRNNKPLIPSDYEFVRAQTLCSLTRIYELNAGQAGTLTLGDLTIQQNSGYKKTVNRGNATTWCELAQALREEAIRRGGLAGIKAVGPRGQGNDEPDPILHRLPFKPYR